MNVSVHFFASLRDSVGTGQITLHLPEGADLTDLVARVVARYPYLDGDQAMWHFAVNQTHADPDAVLHSGDRIAIFPYVAGG